jgi:hypothetical protein
MKVYTARGREERRGSALIILMIVILLVSIGGAAMVGFAKNQAYSMNKVRDYLTAQAYAEAGASEAYALIKSDFALAGDPTKFPLRTFGDGSYDATVTPVGTAAALIECVGTKGSVIATVRMDVKNFTAGSGGGGGAQPTDPYAYSWLVNGQMRMNGASTFEGYLHANNDFDVNGLSGWGSAAKPVQASATVGIRFSGPCTLYGDMRAPAISGSFSPGTTTVAASPVVPLPTLNFTALYNTALANGQVVGSQYLSADTTWTIPGGVKWINGTLTVKSSKTLTYSGCVIATGAIDIMGTVNATPVADKPTLASRDSTMDIGNSTSRGVLYSAGDMTFSGGCDFTGSIFCGGNLTFNGAGDRFAYANYAPGSGGGGGGGGSMAAKVGVTAWQK